MLAIALESVILGRDTNSELSRQLGNRVAHLIGSGLNGRKLVAKTINELYRRRSKNSAHRRNTEFRELMQP